ncbi:MAG: hypothetical protein M1837_000900 [Sclerophora amabilis]|nr:MAG: hypothetical protein M1837_000900 [Sclerophora amabilis]
MSLMDTVGVFARNATLLGEIGARTMSPSYMPTEIVSSPKYRLLYPVRSCRAPSSETLRWFPDPGVSGKPILAEQIMETAIQKIESHLGCIRKPFNLEELWGRTKPDGQPTSLDEAIGKIYSILTTYASTSNKIDAFLKDYREKSGGRTPFIDPLVLSRQRFGRDQTRETFDMAMEARAVFSQWVTEVLLRTADSEEIPILVFPQSFGTPNYRDTLVKSNITWDKFSIQSFGYLCGCPDYTIPVGEVPYMSRITEKEEFLPVSLSMTSKPAHDLILFKILKDLDSEGILQAVGTGPRMFEK